MSGRWTLEDRVERSLREIPFEIPTGAQGVTVRLSYNRDAGVLDLGCGGPEGFRGWSGGARDEFTITADWATPGYLPGEPVAGTWHVWLRLHRIPPEGLDYTLDIETHSSPRDQGVIPHASAAFPQGPVENNSLITGSAGGARGGGAARRRGLPDVDGMRWLAGDFHAHTVHSDGVLTVSELADLAAGRGLDFLAVTDHNTVSHHPELRAAGERSGILLIPGQEVTTDRGHANVFGDVGWVDFRQPADSWLDHATRHGGLISINHPLGGDCAWLQPLTERPRIAEVWHSGWWDRTWGAPLAWADAWSTEAEIIAIGGSDFHRPGSDGLPGDPTTWILAEGDDVLGGLRAGRTAVNAGPDAPLLVRTQPDELLALDADGAILIGPEINKVIRGDRVVVKATPGMHRLETHRNEVIALCG